MINDELVDTSNFINEYLMKSMESSNVCEITTN